MRAVEMTGDEFLRSLLSPVEPAFAGKLVVIDGAVPGPAPASASADLRHRSAVERLGSLPCVVVGTDGAVPAADPLVDIVVADGSQLAEVIETVRLAPIASVSLALALRASETRSTGEGLMAESALYSALQAGPEHLAWRARAGARAGDSGATGGREPLRSEAMHRVRVRRVGDELHVVLNRPEVRNALDARMRNELLEAFSVALADPSLTVDLSGEGRSFCSGGDLDEFGTAPDPATAHVVRLRTSLGAVLTRLARRTTVHLHGACAGSGVELAAFGGHVTATPDVTAELPELGLGLIPGAGGTVSLPRRIGRHRTAWLAFTRRALAAPDALAWGLVDEIKPS